VRVVHDLVYGGRRPCKVKEATCAAAICRSALFSEMV
jgi:hypothetical protein